MIIEIEMEHYLVKTIGSFTFAMDSRASPHTLRLFPRPTFSPGLRQIMHLRNIIYMSLEQLRILYQLENNVTT
jgi:hypothetical protein